MNAADLTHDATPASPTERAAWNGDNGHPLARFIIRRLAQGVVTLVAASAIIFAATSILPGSPASSVLGRSASPALVAQIDHRLGYDQPVPTRYLRWLGDLARGDLGESTLAAAQGRRSVGIWSTIRAPLRNTIVLALVTIALLVPLSLVLGILAGLFAGRWTDQVISTVALVFTALPEFVVGSLLIVVFFVVLDLVPPVSLLPAGESLLSNWTIFVLPVMTLLAVSIAPTVRLVRVGTVEVLQTDYVEAARLAGLPERKILRHYVLRNALVPSVQILALSIQYLFAGVIVTETVFSFPGIGRQMVYAVTSHDNTQVQAIAMLLATVFVAINIVADVVIALLVPKLRTAG